MRCERCWSEEDVEEIRTPTPTAPPVALCAACRAIAPKDPLLFQNLFLRFATRKEFLHHYQTTKESDALHRWCREEDIEVRRLIQMLSGESGGMGLLATPNPLKARGHQAPFGYQFEEGSLVPLPLEAEVVGHIFSMALRGRTLDEIAGSLNGAEVPTRRDARWHRSTIRYLLRNPLYMGYRRWKGTLRASAHPAIVDAETFRRVQTMLVRRVRRPEQRLSTPPPLGGV